MERYSVSWMIFFTLLGALCGTVLGQVVVLLIPASAVILDQGVNLSLDLHAVSLGVRFNVASVLGVTAVLLIFWRRR